ncbi:iron-containing alcohol dehydrogenase [Clostridium sp. 001]|uniref:iron-containing alcohol dehydrogenase n=1 Tax=Clostridium sp. 001 TaxID=1970093 RepID=UPI001C2BB71B|nr:iron-containing alcohol dehydrogenase [Clostridium sp. 001]QXE17866.1 alcohol dehydrogenase [Clostridium sp. 001]
MKKLYGFQTADNIIAGQNSLKTLKDNMKLIGSEVKKALIVTQKPIQDLGFVDTIIDELTSVKVKADVNTDTIPEPTVKSIEDIFKTIKSENYDVLIGIGGGSVLDTTKILSVLLTNNCTIKDILGTDLVKKAGVPTILVPTTAGTGSEVTPNAIVTLPEEGLKIGIVSRYFLPKIVIVDPNLTLGLPKPITASTGMDAFIHSLESFISNKANPISDMFALRSIKLISSSIVEAYQNGSSIEARENMILGSLYGGMALTAAGTAAVHALAYPLGGSFKISHGVANSMLLPHVMKFNMDCITDRLYEVAGYMGIDVKGDTEEQASKKVIERLVKWTDTLHIPQNLREFGVKEENIHELAVAASKVTRLLGNNPKKLSIEDIEAIYRKLLK